jgi:mono/diheme cytochrome c family protein
MVQFRAAYLPALAVAVATASLARADQAVEYNRDIRPILAENCFACHGPDSASRKADLRLDQRDVAVKAEAIVPGNAGESELVARIDATDPSEIMPPPSTRKTLAPADRELLKRWIAAGAEYQPHWSLIPPRRPALPAVQNEAWVRNPIDRFILARLEREGLTPAPEADRRTLARRLSLDLTGLPPEPSVVEAFVNDAAPEAYSRLVDRFLDSADWGEHRGRYWLDAARYADTHGIHFDNYREIWSYREWVIRAFNDNMPFDRFTIEQLAGDLLPNATLDQRIASGFNRCNITTSEGGAIDDEYLVLYARDRTETTALVWMGLTAGCAVCHDHKFDPLSQKEFYALSAFFNNTTQRAMDGNIKDTPPTIAVPRPPDRPRWDELQTLVASARREADERRQSARGEFDRWLASAAPSAFADMLPSEGLRVLAPFGEGQGASVGLTVDGAARHLAINSAGWQPGQIDRKALAVEAATRLELPDAGDFEKDQAFSYGAWVKVPRPGISGALMARMDDGQGYRGWDLWLDNGRLSAHIISTWPDDALKVIARTPLKAGQWQHVFVTYDGSGRAAGVQLYVDGQPQPKDAAADQLKSSIKTTVPWKLAQRNTQSRVDGVALADLRIYARTLSPQDVERLARTTRALWLAAKPAAERTDAEKNELFDWWLVALDRVYGERAARLRALEQEQAAIQARATVAHVMQERPEPAMAYVLNRGEYDRRRDPVKPETPAALPPWPSDLPRNRLGLAQWLLRADQPLTARVTVNRFWQELFGAGLVRTAGDFGVTGELPSHPELLDWLAVEFRESGWDVKRLFKRIVLSSSYRQSAVATPDKLQKDASNRLLSRGPRFRMDAEMVRDYALAASGLLAHRLGGPSVRPYQPEGVWEAVAMIGSNTRDYRQDQGDNLYRRSIYTFWKRAAPPASMDIFNAPSREVCTVRRERTNTPLQALVTLNDPQFVEAARYLAERALKASGAADARLEFITQRLLARTLRPEEARVVHDSLASLAAYYQSHPGDARALVAVGESKPDARLDAPTLAAWTMLTNELMNLDEVLNQ